MPKIEAGFFGRFFDRRKQEPLSTETDPLAAVTLVVDEVIKQFKENKIVASQQEVSRMFKQRHFSAEQREQTKQKLHDFFYQVVQQGLNRCLKLDDQHLQANFPYPANLTHWFTYPEISQITHQRAKEIAKNYCCNVIKTLDISDAELKSVERKLDQWRPQAPRILYPYIGNRFYELFSILIDETSDPEVLELLEKKIHEFVTRNRISAEDEMSLSISIGLRKDALPRVNQQHHSPDRVR
jgi:hypothetical protein